MDMRGHGSDGKLKTTWTEVSNIRTSRIKNVTLKTGKVLLQFLNGHRQNHNPLADDDFLELFARNGKLQDD